MSRRRHISDLDEYLRCSQPHESPEACQEAIEAFEAGVRELRSKYRIQELLVIAQVTVSYAPEGDGPASLGQALTTFSCGDSTRTDCLAAYALGQAQAERRELVNQYLQGGGVKQGKSKRQKGLLDDAEE